MQRLVRPVCAHLSKQTHAKVCAVVSLLASLRTNSSPPAVANRSTIKPPISDRTAPNSSTTKRTKITKKLQGLTKKLSDSHWQGACACNRSALPQMTPHNAQRGGCSLQRLVRRLPPEPIAFVIPGTHVSSLKHVQRPKTTRIDSRRQGGVRSLAARRAGLSRRANPNSPQSDRPKNTNTQNA